MAYKHEMYGAALDKLWDYEREARQAKNRYWGLADELVTQGLVSVEDVAEIWGVHPDTARKRLKAWRERVLEQPRREASQGEQLSDPLLGG